MIFGLFFDWYGCFFDYNFDFVMIDLLVLYFYGIWEVVKFKNGYIDVMFLFLFDLFVVVILWWGGFFQGFVVYVYVFGLNVYIFVFVICFLYFVYRVVCVDVVVDYNELGFWVSFNLLVQYFYKGKFVCKFL